MSIESQILALMESDADVRRLVGNRIYPQAATQGAELPCIVYDTATSSFSATMDGADGYETTTLMLTAFARRDATGKAQSVAIRQALVRLLHGYRDPSPAVGSRHIQGIFATNGNSGFDEELKVFFEVIDFDVHHSTEG